MRSSELWWTAAFGYVKSCVVVRQSQPCWWRQVFGMLTLFLRGEMPVYSGSSLSSTLFGLLYLEDGGSSLLRNAGNYSWHGQTSRQTAVLRMATIGTRVLVFPNERRKKGFTNDAWLFLAYGDVRRTCLVGSDEKAWVAFLDRILRRIVFACRIISPGWFLSSLLRPAFYTNVLLVSLIVEKFGVINILSTYWILCCRFSMELLALTFQVTRAVKNFAALIFLSERRPLYQGKRWLCKN